MLESLKVGVFLVQRLYMVGFCVFCFLINPAVMIWMLRMVNHISLGKWQNNKHNQSVGTLKGVENAKVLPIKFASSRLQPKNGAF